MKALNSIATFASLVAFSAATAFADVPRRGAAVFVDGFDAVGTFAENWGKPHGKVKSEDGRMVANAIGTVTQASPARTAPLDILVEGSIAILDEGRRVGWTGFSLDGYLFLLKPGGSSWLNLNKKLQSADNGKQVKIGGYKTGDSVKLTVVRRKRGGSCEYSFYVNGIPAGTFAAPVPDKPAMPVFSTYDLKSTLDDFGVYALADENASPNLIANASVEHDREGIPSMFARPGRYDFGKGPFEGYERDFLTGFGVDTNEAHSGRTFNPRFVDAEHGDYTLEANSSCRDKVLTLGWMTNGSTDLLGNPRLVDTRGVAFSPAALPDLGCFEIQERKPSGFAGIIF